MAKYLAYNLLLKRSAISSFCTYLLGQSGEDLSSGNQSSDAEKLTSQSKDTDTQAISQSQTSNKPSSQSTSEQGKDNLQFSYLF